MSVLQKMDNYPSATIKNQRNSNLSIVFAGVTGAISGARMVFFLKENEGLPRERNASGNLQDL